MELTMTGQQHWQLKLYEAKAAEMILYGHALGLSHSEAEDVLQDTFLALMKLEKEPDEPVFYSLRAYRHRALNYQRSFWRRLVREKAAVDWFENTPSDRSPLEHSAMAEMSQLPAEQREIIVLKIWHQHTFEEIGALLEISPHTASARYRYGMNKLRKYLEDFDYERLDAVRGANERLDAPSAFSDNTGSTVSLSSMRECYFS